MKEAEKKTRRRRIRKAIEHDNCEEIFPWHTSRSHETFSESHYNYASCSGEKLERKRQIAFHSVTKSRTEDFDILRRTLSSLEQSEAKLLLQSSRLLFTICWIECLEMSTETIEIVKSKRSKLMKPQLAQSDYAGRRERETGKKQSSLLELRRQPDILIILSKSNNKARRKLLRGRDGWPRLNEAISSITNCIFGLRFMFSIR